MDLYQFMGKDNVPFHTVCVIFFKLSINFKKGKTVRLVRFSILYNCATDLLNCLSLDGLTLEGKLQ